MSVKYFVKKSQFILLIASFIINRMANGPSVCPVTFLNSKWFSRSCLPLNSSSWKQKLHQHVHQQLPVSQFSPANPARHVQVYMFMSSLQVPPFLQGLLLHSSMSVEYFVKKSQFILIIAIFIINRVANGY